MKYIVYKPSENSLREIMILFPEYENHKDIYNDVKREGCVLISAGFTYLDGFGLLYCTGKSDSLNIISRQDKDTKLLLNMMERI